MSSKNHIHIYTFLRLHMLMRLLRGIVQCKTLLREREGTRVELLENTRRGGRATTNTTAAVGGLNRRAKRTFAALAI